jgi:myo-inositol 2-dehydrogenase/D-chiro-inositol 1-dehydrogenase
MLRDLHIHDFDLIRWLTGLEVATVYATGSVRRWQRYARHGDVDTAAILLTMEDGLSVVVTGTRHDARGYDVRAELIGSEDAVAVGLDRKTPLRSLEADPPQLGPEVHTSFVERFADAFDAELRAWLDFARGRSENPCPGEAAFHALRISVACERSLAERRPVEVAEVSS